MSRSLLTGFVLSLALVGAWADAQRAASGAASPRVPAVTRADAVADLVGVNSSIGIPGAGGLSAAQRLHAILDLGVRHIRENMEIPGDAAAKNLDADAAALSRAGVSVDFLTYGVSSCYPNLGHAATAAEILAWRGDLHVRQDGYEGANEADDDGCSDPNFAADLPSQQASIAAALAGTRGIASIGPSLVHGCEPIEQTGIAKYFAFSNVHAYGDYPGGTPVDSVRAEHACFPNAKVWVTESGWGSSGGGPGGRDVDAATQEKYTLRLLFELLRNGVSRDYIYRLDDYTSAGDGFEYYGLYDAAGKIKPAGRALKHLIVLFSDRGHAFAPAPLRVTISGLDGTGRWMLFEKHDRTYLLALYLEAPGYDVRRHVPLPVAAQTATLRFAAGAPHALSEITWTEEGTLETTRLRAAAAVPLHVTDGLEVVRISP